MDWLRATTEAATVVAVREELAISCLEEPALQVEDLSCSSAWLPLLRCCLRSASCSEAKPIGS